METNSLSKEAVFYFNDSEYEWDEVKKYTFEECLSRDVSPGSLSEFEDLYNGEDCSDWMCDYYVRIFLPQDRDCDIYVWNDFDYIQLSPAAAKKLTFLPTMVLEAEQASYTSYVEKIGTGYSGDPLEPAYWRAL